MSSSGDTESRSRVEKKKIIAIHKATGTHHLICFMSISIRVSFFPNKYAG